MSVSASPPLSLTLADHIDVVLDDIYARGTTEVEGGTERPIEPTGMRRDQGEAIARLVESIGARRTIETGFAFGLSGLFMVRGMLRSGLDPHAGTAAHFAFDPFQECNWGNAGLRLFGRAQASHLLRFERGRSEYALPRLAEAGERFDVGLIDGDHKFDATFADALYMRRLIKPGGVLLIDDIWLPSVRGVVNFFVDNGVFVEDRELSPALGQATAVLRVPDAPDARSWDHFVPFDFAPR